MVQVRWEGFGGDMVALQAEMERLLEQAAARAALLMDSAGRLLTLSGDSPEFDVTTFVSLMAADFCATRELARMLGEEAFHSVFHQGDEMSLYMTHVTEGTILAVVYDSDSTLGLVRYCVRKALPRLSEIIREGLSAPKVGYQRVGDAFGSEVMSKVNEMFGEPSP